MFVRNLHPRHTVHLPYVPGWSRVLRPGVTTMLPERTLHTPPIRRLLAKQLIAVVDGRDSDPEARQAWAGRTEWARLIAEVEQREFDRLTAGETGRRPPAPRQRRERRRRVDEWSPEQTARLHLRWAEGASAATLAGEFDTTPGAISSKAKREGLGSRRRPQQSNRVAPGPRVLAPR